MIIHSSHQPDTGNSSLIVLVGILFISYLCVAIALPTVPLYVSGTLSLDNVWAGFAVGSAFLATILSRGYAGILSDRFGAKLSVQRGLICYCAGALVSFVAGFDQYASFTSFLILILGRLLLGLGESLVLVGVIGWGIQLVGPTRSGKVLALVGAAIYGALAIGGPAGLALANRFHFSGAMVVSAILPALGLLAVWPIPGIPGQADRQRPPFVSVVRQIWFHGLVVCLQGIGFAGIGAFFALYFLRQNWGLAGLGLTAFGCGFVLVRVFLSALPDRIGGLPVAMASLAVESLGQFTIWGATSPSFALLGAFLTGLGCSMIFPSMGREVVNLVEPHLRSTAVGGFSAFQDLAYGLTGPVAGLLADQFGYSVVFLVGGVAAAVGFCVTLWLQWSTKRAYS